MIGFGVALVLPSEPIGFLGLLPILLGTWKGINLLFPAQEEREGQTSEEGNQNARATGLKSIMSVAIVTIMNGGDNVGTYIPLFSQAEGAEIAIYIVIYYILLGLWCVVAFLIMKEKHVLHMAKRWAAVVVPFLYVGLGIYIVIKSDCYPWSIEHINASVHSDPGKVSMAVATSALILTCIGAMLWFKIRKRAALRQAGIEDSERRDVDEGLSSEQTQDDAAETNPAAQRAASLEEVEPRSIERGVYQGQTQDKITGETPTASSPLREISLTKEQ